MDQLTIWGETGGLATVTPELSKSLSPQELEEHRHAIAFEVRIVLSAYFQPSEPQEIRDGQLAWWCDSLEDWTREQVVYGLRKWNESNPRLRPTPGDITALLKRTRGERELERRRSTVPDDKGTDTAPQILTDEVREKRRATAEEILANAGFRLPKVNID